MFLLCRRCGELMRIGEDLAPRRTTCEDVADLTDEQRLAVQRLQEGIWRLGGNPARS